MEEVWNFCPAMAVPMMVKMPEPMTAPMPREVRLSQPRDFLRRNSAPSQSEMSWSMFLRRKSGDDANRALRFGPARRKQKHRNGYGNEVRERMYRESSKGSNRGGFFDLCAVGKKELSSALRERCRL